MGNLTDYAEQALLDNILGVTSWQPAALWFAQGLSSGAAWDETGTGGTEPSSGTGYARIDVSASWGAADASGFTQNNAAIVGPIAASAIGACSFGALFDASTGGNCLAYFPISAAALAAGQRWRWAVNAFTFSLPMLGGARAGAQRARRKMLDHFFRVAAWNPSLYCGQFTAQTDDETVTEATYTGYSRVSMSGFYNASAQAAWWSGAEQYAKTSLNAQLNGPTNSSGSDKFVNPGVWDASSGGNFLGRFDDLQQTLPNGNRLIFPSGNLIFFMG